IILIGASQGHLGSSLYLREFLGREDGPPPPVDLAAERRNGDLVRRLIGDGLVTACHDLSDGGLLIALAEMAMAGGIGAAIGNGDRGWLFGEDQARYLVTATPQHAQALLKEAAALAVPARLIGETGGQALTLAEGGAISVARLKQLNEAWLPAYMGAGLE
ncbi:MAG: AIR synthase-related protein, partial [Dongiaceae bacterium]